jgi:ABC-type transport system involved in multi-copper enzyme maturation permease subunit
VTFLPIVERELRIAVRKPGTYVVRVLGTLVAFFIAWWLVATMSRFAVPNAIGNRLFHLLTHVAFFVSLFAGVLLTSDCISEEKRDGTIGFLFLTPLRSYDVVAGKLIGASLNAVYALVAIVPVLAIPLILGGVTGAEVVRISMVLLNTLFLSAATGILVSACNRFAQRSVFWTIALVLIAAYAFPMLPALACLSPRTLYGAGFANVFASRSAFFVGAFIAQHFLAWGLLAFASGVTNLTWRESSQRVVTGDATAASENELLLPNRPVTSREPLLDGPPEEWLARRGRKMGWIWGSLALVFAAWMSVLQRGKPVPPGAIITGMACLHLALQFWVSAESARRFNDDRRSGALELLLSTPLTFAQVVQAQWLSLKHQFRPVIFAILGVDSFLVIYTFAFWPWRGEALPEFMTVILAMMFLLIVNSFSLAWTSLWLGLTSRTASRATAGGLGRIIVLPTAIFMVAIYAVWSAAGGSSATPTAATWVIVSGITSYLHYEYCHRRLASEQCRELVCQSVISGPVAAPAEAAERDYGEDYALVR